MKKRIIGATLITVVCALLISNLVGVLLFRSREMDAARNTLQELLVLMDAQSAITDPDGLAQQFHAAAPDKRLTIIDTDGTVLADTEANPQTLEDHNSRPRGGAGRRHRLGRGGAPLRNPGHLHALRVQALCRRHGGPGLHAPCPPSTAWCGTAYGVSSSPRRPDCCWP